MKKIITILCVMFFLSGCMSRPKAPFQVPEGAFYTNTKAPLSIEFHDKKLMRDHGKAESTFVQIYFLGFSLGDNSLEKAVKDGVLEKASYVDYEWLRILSIFGRLTVHAYGVEQPEKD